MKTITFIRHSFLEEPFENYDNLSFGQLVQLAKGEIKPSINQKSQKLIKTKLVRKDVKGVQLILTSQSNRAKQTAQLISETFGINIPIQSTATLNEVVFDPSTFSSKQVFKKYKMEVIRKGVLEGMITGNGAESVGHLLKKISKLEKKILTSKSKNILCVTHGFYMRVLQLYFLHDLKKPEQITLEVLTEAINYGNLEGFEINL